jgi:fatty-acyl-CoA synthase
VMSCGIPSIEVPSQQREHEIQIEFCSIFRSPYRLQSDCVQNRLALEEDMEDFVGIPTMSHAIGPTDLPLNSDTLGVAFRKSAQRFPDRVAIISPWQHIRMTYCDLSKRVDAFAKGLLALDMSPGDRIGLWSPNCVEWTIVEFAAATIGLVLVNLNPAYRARELEYALNKVSCKALVCATQIKTTDYLGILNELAPEISQCGPRDVRASRLPSLRTVIQLGEASVAGIMNFSEVLKLGGRSEDAPLKRIEEQLDCHDPINIQFTSGTTGSPKAAMLSHSNLLNITLSTAQRLEATPDSVVCLPLPLYHVFPMALGNILALTSGATVVLPGPLFEAMGVLEVIQSEKCTSLYGVPTIFLALIHHPHLKAYDLTSLKAVISGGASLSSEIRQRITLELGATTVVDGYGMTESSSSIMVGSPQDPDKSRLETLGRPIANVEVKVVGPSGQTLPVDTAGELCVRGVGIMLGYWEDDLATEGAIDSEGWLHTGDLGTIDANGCGRIVGRLKELVIRGGENIYPREVEDYLAQHPKIESVHVVGVPDDRYGEELCACVKLRDAETVTIEDIRSFCEGGISHFKIPKYVRFVDSFPMTPNGKVQKLVLQRDCMIALGISGNSNDGSHAGGSG